MQSFLGDLHIQRVERVQFYTRQKTRMTRWFESARDLYSDLVWKSGEAGLRPRRLFRPFSAPRMIAKAHHDSIDGAG
jgi:hypothetical protein